MVHFCWPDPYGPWSKVVHCVGIEFHLRHRRRPPSPINHVHSAYSLAFCLIETILRANDVVARLDQRASTIDHKAMWGSMGACSTHSWGEQRRSQLYTPGVLSLLVFFSKPFVGEGQTGRTNGFWQEDEGRGRKEYTIKILPCVILEVIDMEFSLLLLSSWCLGNNVIHHLIFLTSHSFISGFLNSLVS